MAGLQQFYFFPTDFLDTIRDLHPSSALPKIDAKKMSVSLSHDGFVQKRLNDDHYKMLKIASDSLPTRVVPLNKHKIDVVEIRLDHIN
ncbi:hypothetical protein QVD17_22516 [Tagetes erecta]|uniref:Uncharacterized protein n=1 Tax=Tagetes erecta TaxID=13708 RepID=A0AAD8KGL7_TARER|nr:hypothetical protein QVD17_22516 [Tagetes erecta]